MINKELYDPFDEEDWDEKEHSYYYFKVWIGIRTREVKILCIKPHVKIDDNIYYIYDDKFNVIYKIDKSDFFHNIENGIKHGNGIFVDSTNYRINNIINFISSFLKSRKDTAIDRISNYNNIISGDEDVDEDVDINQVENNLEKEELLLNNIDNLLSKNLIETVVRKLIKLNF